jgi:hypothetical protein
MVITPIELIPVNQAKNRPIRHKKKPDKRTSGIVFQIDDKSLL